LRGELRLTLGPNLRLLLLFENQRSQLALLFDALAHDRLFMRAQLDHSGLQLGRSCFEFRALASDGLFPCAQVGHSRFEFLARLAARVAQALDRGSMLSDQTLLVKVEAGDGVFGGFEGALGAIDLGADGRHAVIGRTPLRIGARDDIAFGHHVRFELGALLGEFFFLEALGNGTRLCLRGLARGTILDQQLAFRTLLVAGAFRFDPSGRSERGSGAESERALLGLRTALPRHLLGFDHLVQLALDVTTIEIGGIVSDRLLAIVRRAFGRTQISA
jgi:hypothetical protein